MPPELSRSVPSALVLGVFLFVLSLPTSLVVVSSEIKGIILSPSEAEPLSVDVGDQFEARIVLRLPLTPPPGVQQPRAWKGWSVRLERHATIALRGASPDVYYATKVLRIRPKTKNEYALFAVTLPWMSPGIYDLTIVGPGFVGKAVRSVRVGLPNDLQMDGVEVEVRGNSTVLLRNNSKNKWFGLVDVVIPMNGPGLSVLSNGTEIEPMNISPTGVFAESKNVEKVGRVFCFEISISPSNDEQSSSDEHSSVDEYSNVKEIVFKESQSRSKKISIQWERREEKISPVEWCDVKLKADFPIKGAVWRFGDGEWGRGEHVRHRWLFSTEARVDVVAFDSYGNKNLLSDSRSLNAPMSRGSCSCNLVGRRVSFYGKKDILRVIWQLFD